MMKKKILYIVACVLLVTFSFAFGLIYIANQYIKSSEGFDYLTSKLSIELKKSGVNFSYKTGFINLFNTLELKDVNLIIQQDTINLNIGIPSLRADWGFYFRSPQVRINKIHISSLSIVGQIQNQSKLDSPPHAESTHLDLLEATRQHLESLPVGISIEEFKLENLSAQVNIGNSSQPNLYEYRLERFNYDSKLKLVSSIFSLSHQWEVQQSLTANHLNFSIISAGDQQLSLEVDYSQPEVTVKVTQFQQNLAADFMGESSPLKNLKFQGNLENPRILVLHIMAEDIKLGEGKQKKELSLKTSTQIDFQKGLLIPSGTLSTFIGPSLGPDSKSTPSLGRDEISADLKWSLDFMNSQIHVEGLINTPLNLTPATFKIPPLQLSVQSNWQHKHNDPQDLNTLKTDLTLQTEPFEFNQIKINPTLQMHIESSQKDSDFKISANGELQFDNLKVFDFDINSSYSEDQSLVGNISAKLTEEPIWWKSFYRSIEFFKGSHFRSEWNVRGPEINAQVDVAIPNISIEDLLQVKNTRVRAQISTPQEKLHNIKVLVDQGPAFFKSGVNIISLESGFAANIAAQVNKDQIVQLETVEFNFDKDIIQSKMTGRADLSKKNMQLNGEINFRSPFKRISTPQLEIVGEIDIPWDLAVQNGNQISLQSDVIFKNIRLIKDDISVENLNGYIQIKEELKDRGGQWGFSYLLRQSGFERVAFSKILPFLNTSKPLKFDKIKISEKLYGPFIGYISLNQNLLNVHKFDLSLSSASVSGETYIDLHPQQVSLGLLTRFSNFNLEKILPDKFLKGVNVSKPLSGRTNIVTNLSKGYVNGRLDITDISPGQLIALINILDPYFEDQKLNSLRSYLSYAFPTYVGLNFNHSYMDIDVKTNIINIPQIKSVPFGSHLNELTKILRDNLKEVPFR